jgi:hypothetical protein
MFQRLPTFHRLHSRRVDCSRLVMLRVSPQSIGTAIHNACRRRTLPSYSSRARSHLGEPVPPQLAPRPSAPLSTLLIKETICVEHGVTRRQLADVVKKHQMENPKNRNQAAVALATAALKRAWPCPGSSQQAYLSPFAHAKYSRLWHGNRVT